MSFDPVKKAQKWQSAMQGASQSYTDGVNSVQTAPGQSAAARQDTLLQRFTKSVQDGTWATAVASVPLQSWKDAATKYGAANLVNGAAKGAPKMQRYLTAAAPVYATIKQQIRSMPNATDSDRQQRMIANMQAMKQLKGLGKRV